jgi:hypothetical protein
MRYSFIRDLLKANDADNTDCKILLAIDSALSKPVSDKVFDMLCAFTSIVYSKLDCKYIQLLADIVVDLYQGCGYGYRPLDYKLTLKDLSECNQSVINAVMKIFYSNY